MFPRQSTVFRYATLLVLVLVSGVMIFQLGVDTDVVTSDDDDDIIVPVSDYNVLSDHREYLPSSKGSMRPTTTAVRRDMTTPSGRYGLKSTDNKEVNPHKFKYRINNPSLCARHNVFIVTYVHSAPANLKKRQTIRDTWGNHAFLKLHNITVVFIMGTVPDAKVMQLVDMESSRYGDLVQEDFVDSYRNLTYKAIAAIKWVSTFCPKAKFVLKTDDDILVNFHLLLDFIRNTVERSYGSRDLIMCNLWLRMKVMRDTRSKWYIPKEDFREDFFPPYCSGSAYLMSADVVDRMYKVSMSTPFFWVDDYYITGMLVRKLNLKHRRYNEAYVLHPGHAQEKYDRDKNNSRVFFHIHKLRTMYQLWANMTSKYIQRTASTNSVQRLVSGVHLKTVFLGAN